VKRGLALIVTVVAAGALLRASGPTAASSAVGGVRLKTITSRTHNAGASLVIEASEPVGYVVTRPDPLTVMVDFRNVNAEGLANSAVAKSPIAGVAVEAAESLGAPSSRVRITLSQPVAYRVRSDRNSVVVDFDKPTGKPYILPAETAEAKPRANQSTVVDPIAALGLNAPVPVASSPTKPLPTTPSQPVVSTVQGGLGGLRAQQTAVQVPGASTQTPAQPDQATPRRFTGNPITLDFQGADLRAVLRIFSEVSGLNIVIDPQVQGNVDVALKDVPWDQALDIILRANRLGYSVDGTIVRIAPLATLALEEKERTDLAKAQADAGTLGTLTRQLNYSKGEEIVALLKGANILSNRGQAFVDPRTNTLIINDLQERLTSAGDLITTLDKPQPQVEIEARIVQTNRNYARALGVQWGFNGAVSPQLGNTTNLAFPNSGAIGGRVGPTQGPAGPGGPGSAGGTSTATAVNLGAAAATSAIGIQLGSVNGAFNLDVALSALETSGNGKLLSTPKVSTLNNVPAEITQGIDFPIQTQANNTVTTTFKQAALSLKVIPQITAAGTVIMQIALENSSPDFGNEVLGIPSINKQAATTSVLVMDGQTTVIGGIYTSSQANTRDNTPGLANIPLLGWLFRRDTINDKNTELLIFITPRIVKEP
jgi:type IV pilus assembly protein PilQ